MMPAGSAPAARSTKGSPAPLLSTFPSLALLPRAELGRQSPPIQRDPAPDAQELWVWRDDLNAPVAGGNKLRALEFLLGSVRRGDHVATMGGVGSTHVYATATHALALGASTTAVRWPHETTQMSEAVRALAARRCARVHDLPLPLALLTAARLRIAATTSHNLHWVPFGGSSPLGILGQLNGALELVERVERGEVPRPSGVVVPVGSAGTVAGLLLGLALAGWDTTVIGARCGPRAGITRHRVMGLARRTAALVMRLTGERIPVPRPGNLLLDHSVYGGAYGRPHPEAQRLAASLHERIGVVLDPTYGAKALLAARRQMKGTSQLMLWSTFDGREFDGMEHDE